MNHGIFHGLSDILVEPVHHCEQVKHHAGDGVYPAGVDVGWWK